MTVDPKALRGLLEKPKPCPRCEFDKPEVYSECEDFDDLVYRVNCGYCGFESKCADNETQAIIYWDESLAQELRADLNAAKAENEKLREGLEALASLEAMTTSFRIKNNSEGEELKARVEFARNLLKGGE